MRSWSRVSWTPAGRPGSTACASAATPAAGPPASPGRSATRSPSTAFAQVSGVHQTNAGRNRLAPTVVAAQRFDHLPITGRSCGQRLVHPSITCHSVAPQGLNTTGYRAATPRRWRAAAPIPARKGAVWVTPRPGSAVSRTCEPGQEHPAQVLAQHRCGPRSPSSSRAIRPCVRSQPEPGQLPHQPPAPTRSPARIRLSDQPCSTHRALKHAARSREAEFGQPSRPTRLPRLHPAPGLGRRPLGGCAPYPSDAVALQQSAHCQPMRGQLRRHPPPMTSR
jgi:hypothetical protein